MPRNRSIAPEWRAVAAALWAAY